MSFALKAKVLFRLASVWEVPPVWEVPFRPSPRPAAGHPAIGCPATDSFSFCGQPFCRNGSPGPSGWPVWSESDLCSRSAPLLASGTPCVSGDCRGSSDQGSGDRGRSSGTPPQLSCRASGVHPRRSSRLRRPLGTGPRREGPRRIIRARAILSRCRSRKFKDLVISDDNYSHVLVSGVPHTRNTRSKNVTRKNIRLEQAVPKQA